MTRMFSRPDPAPAHSRFIPELESIRGIAAFFVAITHALIAFKYGQTDTIWLIPPWQAQSVEMVWVSFLLILFNGAAAVTVFFVLSGIVLGMALDTRVDRLTVVWREFVVARIARIFPSVIAVIAFIVIYLNYFNNNQLFAGASLWYGWWYRSELSLELILRNLLLLDHSLNPVAWTLAVEVAVALMFPLLFKLSRSVSVSINSGIVLVLMVLANYLPEYLLCAHLYKFYIGLLLPMYAGMAALQKLYRLFPLLMSLLLLLSARAIWGFASSVAMLAETLATALLLGSLCARIPLHPLAKWVLRAKWVRWAGRVSYSFYLWHFVMLYIFAHLLFTYLPAAWIQANTLCCSLGLAAVSITVTGVWATLMYRLVERHGMRLGKWVIVAMRKIPYWVRA